MMRKSYPLHGLKIIETPGQDSVKLHLELPGGHQASGRIYPDRHARISMVVVGKESEGRGIGSALYRRFIDEARGRGATTLEGTIISESGFNLTRKVLGDTATVDGVPLSSIDRAKAESDGIRFKAELK